MLSLKRFIQWAGQAALAVVTFTLAVAIILLVTSGEKLDVPAEAFSVGTPMVILLLGYYMQKMILKNRHETQKARDEMLEEMRRGIAEVLEVTRACLPRQKRETIAIREGRK